MYVKVVNNIIEKFPYYISDLITENPNVSFPLGQISTELLEVFNVFPIVEQPQPQYNSSTQKVVEIAPVNIAGIWTQRWQVVNLNQQEQLQKLEQLKNSIVQATQERLDNFAKTRNYDGIMSCCTYSTSSNLKFQTEGQYCMQQRDQTWATLYQILAEVESGTRPIPQDYSDIESQLPTLVWPN